MAKSKGLGDTISKITHTLHIKECEGCVWRKEKLNTWFPYNESKTNYCGFGKSLFFKPPFWSFQNASCKIHDDNYEKGGNKMDRMTADTGFLWRMIQDGNQQTDLSLKKKAVYSAIIYFILVRLFGWITFFSFKKKMLSTVDSSE